jgi:hypothetical protein
VLLLNCRSASLRLSESGITVAALGHRDRIPLTLRSAQGKNVDVVQS